MGKIWSDAENEWRIHKFPHKNKTTPTLRMKKVNIRQNHSYNFFTSQIYVFYVKAQIVR